MKYKLLLLLLIIPFLNVRAEEIITVSSKTTLDKQEISSSTINKSGLYVTDGDLTLTNSKVFKDGNFKIEDVSNKDNSAVIISTKSKLSMEKSEIETKSLYAHGIYFENESENSLKSSKITTNNGYSAGIVNDGGSVTLNDMDIETTSSDSSGIVSLRGNIDVDKSRITTKGNGSPIFKAAGSITFTNSTLLSNNSEGFTAIGGANIKIDKTELTSNNTMSSELNKNFMNILLYNPEEVNNKQEINVEAKDSKIISKNGDSFNVVNAIVNITLNNTEITNERGIFLKGQSLNYDGERKTGSTINLKLINQTVAGDIVLDNNSKVTMNLDNSTYTGSINGQKVAKSVDIVLTKDSHLVLTGSTYVDSLTNGDYDNKNIDLNGYHLYIKGDELSKDNIIHLNKGTDNLYVYLGAIIGAMLGFSVVYLLRARKSNEK